MPKQDNNIYVYNYNHRNLLFLLYITMSCLVRFVVLHQSIIDTQYRSFFFQYSSAGEVARAQLEHGTIYIYGSKQTLRGT